MPLWQTEQLGRGELKATHPTFASWPRVPRKDRFSTEFPDLPANVSYDIQGVLDESPLDVSNDMNQSDGSVELRALPPN
ncbi:hypothetical protein DSO57_1032007 [Entomophthora muscae]|uniref:Uncharacterized protein n=1 Tax=Entomophthora muscae TaxID=34485 RepID=A0ACC2TMW2_9FUNG|nr:hypothetical protein DSO57_1032007 [Entomophthora muscae]